MLRTDGVYIYDNDIRTYTPATKEVVEILRNAVPKNPNVKQDPLQGLYPQSCLPEGSVGAGISKNSLIVILMFSKSGYSFEYLTSCRDEKTWENIKKMYADFQKYASSKVAQNLGVLRVKFLDPKVFIVEVPKMELRPCSYEAASSYFLYKDSIVERKSMPPEAYQGMDEETKAYLRHNDKYVFTPLDKVPETFKGGIKILKPTAGK